MSTIANSCCGPEKAKTKDHSCGARNRVHVTVIIDGRRAGTGCRDGSGVGVGVAVAGSSSSNSNTRSRSYSSRSSTGSS